MNFRKQLLVTAGVMAGLVMLSIGSVSAQVIGVLDRPRPAYDPKGIPLGAFRLYPKLNFDTAYDDNVFRLPAGQSDWYLRETPTVRLESQWNQHYVEVFGGADNYNYTQFSSLDVTDWNVGGAGRYDVTHGSAIAATASYGEDHEALYSPNTAGNQISPTKYHKQHSGITGTYQPNRIGLSAGFTFDRLVYASVPLSGGGLQGNADRNKEVYQAYARGIYEASPGYSAFVKVSYDGRTFDQYFDRSGYHRSSNGFRIDGGVDLQISNLVDGELYAGYLEQHYAQNVPKPLQNISGLDFGGQINWYPTPLLTVHLSAAHEVSDVVVSGVSGSRDETAKLTAEYELGHDLIAQAYGAYTHSNLEGISRSDNYPSAGVDLRYLVNRYLSASVSFDHGERSSNLARVNYHDNLVSLRLTGHI